jgi:hypothetical protein
MRLASNGAVISINRVLIVVAAVFADALSGREYDDDLARFDLSHAALDQFVDLILK